MSELWIHALAVDDAGDETPAATRDRLRGFFPPLALRRMTQLGMLVGATMQRLGTTPPDTIVYASSYGESRALESYLDGFPTPSPTLFQTSIHPSGVQQGLIGRQQPVPELYPLSGGAALAGHALATAATNGAASIVLCGGEERGTYLLERGVASDRTFAFALLLGDASGDAPLGRLSVRSSDGLGALALGRFFDLLRDREPFDGSVAPGWHAVLEWNRCAP
ncbi:hypothetical protein ASA1KI_43360 [Opitutales bacterium ASA1]|uniref:hypothetical protein n=1 Tax=Congregicoccus parvus TaxID=3081749 RepID=UPI002B2C05D9|nr:hypothetical protein ASA1KI_43360 [Opitutales bacterium ASA1]